MKKSFKKLVLISMSAITLGAIAPTVSIFAQEDSETTVDSMIEDSMEETTVEEDEEEVSPMQKALEEIVKKYQEDYPEVGINRIIIQPLEEDEEDDLSVKVESEMGMADDESEEEMTQDEMSDEEMTEDEMDEVDPFKITIEGTDEEAMEDVTVSYDARTKEEIPEDENEVEDRMSEAEDTMDDMMSDAEDAMDDMMSDAEDAMDDMMSDNEESESDTEEEMSDEPLATIDFEDLAGFDEIKEAAEEEAGMGEALEFVYSVNEETDVTEVAVFVYENTEEPTEGKMMTITLDATTLEVLKVEGSEVEEAVDSEGNAVTSPQESNNGGQDAPSNEETTTEESEGHEETTTEESEGNEETTTEESDENEDSDTTEENEETTSEQ
ncbi:hypothetical protein ACQV2W_05165 [Facklamia sp. P12934]|uniref:hypothetical protein n=1 Tax=Facklamia sp. P12934 TaxID=3421948 RepID=UPI003D172761